jgi:Asp-tRNA(Asn)/Glu-tRNA(Gln) amidotransferase C subunit
MRDSMRGMETPGIVTGLAALARISVPTERREALEQEFVQVVAYIDQLQELSLSKGEPSVPAVHSVFRTDEGATPPSTWTNKVVEAFPTRTGNLLTVKKIISHD